MSRGARVSTNLLYGQRRAFRRSKPARSPLPATPAECLEAYGRLASADPYPGRNWHAGLGLKFVSQSALLTAAPTQKEYRGHIAVGQEDGETFFVGCVAYGRSGACGAQGKINYRGPSLGDAIAEVNKQLDNKMSSKGSSVYSPQSGTGGALLSLSEVVDDLKGAV